MKSDPLFFHLFKNLPSSFFRLVGRREADAKRYKFLAIEYKATAVRLDGVFFPTIPRPVRPTFGKRNSTHPINFTRIF